MDRDDAVYEGFIEIVPYTNKEITVEVEDGDDEYGVYIIVHHDGKQSSKIRYETDKI